MSIRPIVKRNMKTGKGKGFSKAELKDAELSVNEAFKRGIPIDPRRSTRHQENVKMLRAYTKKAELGPPVKEEKDRGIEKVKTAKRTRTVDPKAVKKFIKAVEEARSAVK